jgi:sulfatase modifying factor 1
MRRWSLALGLAPFALGGCLLTIDDGLVPEGGSPGDGTVAEASLEAGPGDGTTETTPEAGCPAGMVQVPAPDAGPSFCVDSTEVTDEAYAAFLVASNPPASGTQIPDCSWNTSYVPAGGAPGSDDLPVHAVNWCDAYAYCAWAGKRLCGAIGGGPFLDFEGYPGSPSQSQWYTACSRGGTQAFPYAGPYQPTACNGAPVGAGAPVAVGSLKQCVGGYPGLFDMSGNVSEFLDSCSTTPNAGCGTGPECDLCLLVGGGFLSGADGGSNIDCAYGNEVYRNSTYDDNGFRCCADL